MSFLNEHLQPAARRKLEDRERDVRLGKVPSKVMKFQENHVALPAQKQTDPRSSTPVEEPLGVPVRDRQQEKIDALQATVGQLTARLAAIIAEDKTPIAQPTRVKPIITAVARYYSLSVNQMISFRRARYVARPRHIAMYLARELTGKSLPVIGRIIHRDHTTVLRAAEAVALRRKTDARLDREITDLIALLTPGEANGSERQLDT